MWDHNADGSITFNLLYSFENNDRIFRKEAFEEHYHPFGIDLALDKMKDLGYVDIAVSPVPCYADEKEFSGMDWYRVIGQKSLE